MAKHRVPLDRVAIARFGTEIKSFGASEVGTKAKLLFASLIVLYLAINGLNVVNSYVGRDFMTAISNKQYSQFTLYAMMYIGVFAMQTIVAVLEAFGEQRLGLLWREFLTKRTVGTYLGERVYYRLRSSASIANPDERITDDIKNFTTTTLSFVLMMFNGLLTVIAFASVLWTISPELFGVAIGYAALGSLFTVILGRPLVWLDYSQLDKEATFRADLIHVRENAESIALLHHEQGLKPRLLQHLDDLVANMRRIISINRNLGFFTNAYNYMIQIIPALIVAPLFIRGDVEFGVITQSAMAFSTLIGAFSLVVNQFSSISSFAAVVARLSALGEAMERAQAPATAKIELEEDALRIAYEDVTLRSPHEDETILIRELSVAVPPAGRLLILGSNQVAKAALLRATAGIWDTGTGRIVRPKLDQVMFVPERPYLPPGSLRDLLLDPAQRATTPDGQLMELLGRLDLGPFAARTGGLDVEKDWNDHLSVSEQKLLAFARVLLAKPRFAFLDRPSAALSPTEVVLILTLLEEASIGFLTLGASADAAHCYQTVLELGVDGAWKTRPSNERPTTAPGAPMRAPDPFQRKVGT